MSYVYLVSSWLFGLISTVAGLGSLLLHPFSSLPLLLAACLLLPPIRQFVFSKIKRELPGKAIVAIVFALMMVFGSLHKVEIQWASERATKKQAQAEADRVERQRQARQDYFTKNREQVLSKLNAEYDKDNYQKVMMVAEIYLDIGDQELQSIYDQASERFNVIQAEQKLQALLDKLAYLPSSDIKKNAEIYRQLVVLKPDNDTYKEKYSFYHGKLTEQRQIAQAKTQAEHVKQQQRAARHKLIANQFSSWDGSHRKLTQRIKQGMHDPNSYDHVETRYWNNGSFLVVITIFRGKNGFGGVVKNTVRAKVDFEGNIIEILS